MEIGQRLTCTPALVEEKEALRFTTRGPQQSEGQHDVCHGGTGTSWQTERGVNKAPDRHAMHVKASCMDRSVDGLSRDIRQLSSHAQRAPWPVER